MSACIILHVLFICVNITFSLALCSSYDYVNQIRNLLSKQANYYVYEGKLIFRQNASFYFIGNPNGIYGTPYFDNIDNITNPQSISPHSTYYFRSSNALIFAGCTPPKSIYFSFVSYIMDRFNDQNKTYIEQRKVLYASLGAALNNLEWNTSSNKNNITNNYDSLTTLIQTGDNNIYNDIYNMLVNNGISDHEINLQSLPNKYIKWLPYKYNNNNIQKYNITYDTGTFLLRVALTENKNQYLQYINTNQTIFLLEPKNINPDDNTPKQPFEPFVRNTYSSNNFNESSIYNDTLNEYKNDLINYVETTYSLTYKKTKIFANMLSDFNTSYYGFYCIEQNIMCGGDNRDAQYWQSGSIINTTLVDNDLFYIILGVIHTNYDIQQTLYSNIVYEDSYYINNSNHNQNLSITNFEYNGSGLILPVKTNINKTYLQNIFVIQLATSNLCINQLPGFCINEQDKKGSAGSLIIRNYLNPITKTRPHLTEIVPSVLIQFQK